MMTTEVVIESAVNKPADWVQKELFVDLLKETVKGFSKIKSFKTNSGSAIGENYATIMVRVNIVVELEDGKEKSVSYMIKLPHQQEAHERMLGNNNIFGIEQNMYKTFVPEMEQLYRDAGVEVNFGAKSYEVKGAKSLYILLEDLAPRGFKNINRLEGLDQAHTEAALRKLSQWHAASAVRVATKGDYPKEFIFGFFKEENRAVVTEMNNGLGQAFLKCCGTYEGNQEYIEQVKSAVPKVTEQCYKMSKPDPTEFNALNHGDLWSNNMMFSHDSFGNIKETYFVDFQLPKYGSVAQDLYYFLMSSTKFEDKVSKFDHYINFYHQHLVENLKLLKFTKHVPTLSEFHISLLKYGFFGYISATGVMSGVLLDATEISKFENFLSDSKEGNDFKMLLFSNPRYRKHIQAVLPWLLNRGALEDF
ncbi:uncharacterized protein LOC133838226 [Drosophila sulfurigaster albostrigata]|uniref:uncharacterized protein LOC133838226 n=1 Tax=Drosophila sulfurigaster albostrigata TaxID=89887 RepID=UPI002D21A402|nr:uncharacterized protein LOC133838226 [Drosophila sulfurigaster albostrigata]